MKGDLNFFQRPKLLRFFLFGYWGYDSGREQRRGIDEKELRLPDLNRIPGLCPSLALAKDTEKDLKDAARKIDKAAASPEGAEKVTKSLSEKFTVPPSTIREFRAQKMGYGEIGILLALSQTTGKTPSELLRRFKSGEGWGKIAKSEGVKLGQ